MSHILTKEGVRGMYAGYSSFLLRDLPFDAIQFCVYEQAKSVWQLAVGRELTTPEIGTIGALAGAFTGFITTPLDVLKTRLMTQGASGQYKGVVDCAIKVRGRAARWGPEEWRMSISMYIHICMFFRICIHFSFDGAVNYGLCITRNHALCRLCVQIARNEGAGAFLRGWEPRVTWIGIGGSIFFGALEASKKFYAPKNDTLN